MVSGLVDLKDARQDSLTRRVYNLAGFAVVAGDLCDAVRPVVLDAKPGLAPDQEMIELVENLPMRLDDTSARQDWNWSSHHDLDGSVCDMVRDIRAHRYVYEL